MSEAVGPDRAGAQFCGDGYVFEFTGDAELVHRLEALFVDLAAARVSEPHEWHIDTFGAHARLTIDGTDVREWVQRDGFVASVISTLNMAVIGSQPTKLHLHASAVVHDDRTMILLAPSGSGKSTLTCALVAAGALYRTDEAVAVEDDGRRIATFPKPITVKRTGIKVVEQLTGATTPEHARSWVIPASSIGMVAVSGDQPVTTLVFNTHVPEQPAIVEPMHRATALRCLLSDSQDVELIGPQALVVGARLVEGAHCVRATGGDAGEVAEAILETHRCVVDAGEVVEVEAASGRAMPHRAPDVTSVVVDGRAVLFTPEPHRLVELDEAQTLWWVLLDGTPVDASVDEVVQETGAARTAVAQSADAALATFRSLGVITDH